MEVFTREDGTAMWIGDVNYQEYVFDYSANSAEVETGGVRVNMIPREGGNRFSRTPSCRTGSSPTAIMPGRLAKVAFQLDF